MVYLSIYYIYVFDQAATDPEKTKVFFVSIKIVVFYNFISNLPKYTFNSQIYVPIKYKIFDIIFFVLSFFYIFYSAPIDD